MPASSNVELRIWCFLLVVQRKDCWKVPGLSPAREFTFETIYPDKSDKSDKTHSFSGTQRGL